jgi:L-iditol 2-dehydrogenase
MKALILREYNEFVYEDVPDPTPGADEVLVSVEACGICGSDVHGMDGSSGRRRPPLIMGHEAAGVISALGSGVREWKPGDRVTFDSTIYCGHCFHCRRGEINLCDHRRVLGVSCGDYRQDGAFAEFVRVPERILYRLPTELSFEHAAMVEPFSIALHAVGLARPVLNDSVVVVGAGMIGLALVQVLKQAGCGMVIVVDVSEDRLARARAMGATNTINSAATDAKAEIAALTYQRGPDLCFEAVGLSETVDLAVRVVRKGGRVVLVGNVTPEIKFPLQVAVTRELSIQGSCASRGEYPAVLQMMGRGALDPRPLISAVAPLHEGGEWFGKLYRKEGDLLKVILRPR